MRLLILLAALGLAGCATAQRVPERVEIPVQVPCRVTVPPEPVWATAALTKDAGIFDQAKALLAERAQRRAYEAKLEAAARSCQ